MAVQEQCLLEQLFSIIWREELVFRQWWEGLVNLFKKGEIKRTRVINPQRTCAGGLL